MSEKMDRGTPALKMLEGHEKIKIRHARRGWCQEFWCCIYKSEFTYMLEGKTVAESTEEYSRCCRMCCAPHHPFEMTVRKPDENDEGEEFIEVDRPVRCCVCCCKCCFFQELTVGSGDEDLGEIRETFWCCVPQWKVYDHDDDTVYIIHPATCCGGMCINCCADGNCCPHGCHLIPCRIYPGDADSTVGDAEFVGKMLKIPKSSFAQTFHEANNYEIQFPKDATPTQKGLLLGSSFLLNALWFEGSE